MYCDNNTGDDLALAAWLTSLHGEKGDKGDKGNDGKSAYDLYCDINEGTDLSLEEWLASLVGANGKNGKSAYELAYEADNTIGTQQEWLLSLKGKDGKSAYEIYCDNHDGEDLSVAEWLASLKGDQGPKGDKGDKGDTGDAGIDGKTPYVKNGNWWIGDSDTGITAEASNGIGVQNAYVDENLHLWIELSNGTKIDAGYVGVTVTPPASPTSYTVTFKDWDGATLKTETVESDKAATAPANPSRTGYVFAGWDKTFSNITSDLIVTATYTQITDPTIVIGNVSGNAGDEVVVTFDLVNSPELYAMSLKIAFDDTALTLVSAESGEAMDAFTYTNPSRLKNGSNFMWYANDPATGNGTVLKLTFKINEGTAAGTYPITMTCDPSNTYDANDNDVNLEFVYGSIVVNG